MAGRFEFVEHTADLGIRAEGDTLGDAFAAAALGLFSHISDPSRVREVGEVLVEVETGTIEQALVAWLEELRFMNETKLAMFARFECEVEVGAKTLVRGRAFGETYDAERHGHIHEVKAVTLYGLKVRVLPPLVEVVLDI